MLIILGVLFKGLDLCCWRIGGICKNNWNFCSGGYIKGLCGGGLLR